jgi:toxin ParE1/3/4
VIYRVEVLPEARADLLRLTQFLAEKSPAAANRARATITTALRSLRTLPDRAPVRGDGRGRVLIIPFGDGGYAVHYVVMGSEVVISRIFHTREDR